MAVEPEIDGPPVPEPEALRLEELAVATIAGEAVAMIKNAMAEMIALARSAGGVLRETVVALLRAVAGRAPDMSGPVQSIADQAKAMGIASAMRWIEAPGGIPGSVLDWRADPADLPDLNKALADGLAEALALAGRAAVLTGEDVNVIAGRVMRTAGHLEGEARRIANEEINQGTAEVARAAGLNLIWVPERNACLDCLAHAGWVVEPDRMFPPVSFDPKRAGRVWTVPWPPLHPNCRCRVRTTDAAPGRPDPDRSSTEPGAALAREARRVVVYQWTDHESRAASRRAAEALLKRGAGLPKSVESRARAALKKDQPVRRP